MIDDLRKKELVYAYAAYMERYLDKQWIDSEARDMVADNQEENDFIRDSVFYSVIAECR